ncbi:MAG TPA: M1 family metallopeptidase [Candidatus Saccharimonadales bacterium]|nr:M1 family metallopeptidase [Candidatus Saccharimonadales bacterium]
MSKKVRRLFEGFKPSHYMISLNPNRDDMTIAGTVTIRGRKTGAPSHRLTFHQNGLSITKATITKHDKKETRLLTVDRINHQRSLEEVRLHSKDALYAGEYSVMLEFSGTITRPMEGIYPCNYMQDGRAKQFIATQFESHAARQAFPCIDEPEAKATFDLTITSPINEAVYANTPIKHQATEDDALVTTFETTPVMSTYLLAFAYGDFAQKEATTKNGTLVRTLATRDNIAHTDFALQTAVRCLEFFESYFDIPFPLPKCDFVALPDFAAGAMENWGFITFREQALLVDAQNTSLPSKQYVAEVICHELTHQWFGNLVTMRWWTDLWLNEGFANVMAYFAVSKLFPEWDMMTQYIVEEQQVALKLDSLKNTHPIEVAVNHPDEIPTIFDAISYNKGGSSIMMLSNYLGQDTFRDGLRHYLKTHAYGNTNTVDLWQALEEISKKPINDMMSAWTSQAGYPLVQVKISGNNVHLQQERFFVNPSERLQTRDTAVWPIALNAGENAPAILRAKTATFKAANAETLKLNQGQSSFCRVIYNPEHLHKLAKLVEAGHLAPVDRMGILSDAFEAAKAGYGDTVSALKLMDAYRDEDADIVWDIMAANFTSIRLVMNDDHLRETTKPYGRAMIAKQLSRLGWEPRQAENHFDTLLRPTILAIASTCDEKTVVDEALKRFKTMQASEDIAPDLRGLIYTTAARHGNTATFDKLLALHNASSSPEERVTLAAALTGFKQPELIKRSLALITSENVRLQDVMYWISYSLGNRFARDATWQWLKDNWQWLKTNMGNDTSFTSLPARAARVMSSKAFLEDYTTFFSSVMEPAIERSFNQGLETIEWQAAWRDRDLERLRKYFESYSA